MAKTINPVVKTMDKSGRRRIDRINELKPKKS